MKISTTGNASSGIYGIVSVRSQICSTVNDSHLRKRTWNLERQNICTARIGDMEKRVNGSAAAINQRILFAARRRRTGSSSHTNDCSARNINGVLIAVESIFRRSGTDSKDRSTGNRHGSIRINS